MGNKQLMIRTWTQSEDWSPLWSQLPCISTTAKGLTEQELLSTQRAQSSSSVLPSAGSPGPCCQHCTTLLCTADVGLTPDWSSFLYSTQGQHTNSCTGRKQWSWSAALFKTLWLCFTHWDLTVRTDRILFALLTCIGSLVLNSFYEHSQTTLNLSTALQPADENGGFSIYLIVK